MGSFAQEGKHVWDVLPREANMCGMFCPGWQICVECFVQC